MHHVEDSSGVALGSIISQKFRLDEKLGQGSFGMIFKCFNMENLETYAMKLEKRNQRHSSMLMREIKVMMELKNEFGYARMISFGKEEDYNYIVMTNLGKNLDHILKKCGQRFSIATCMNIADQTLLRLEVLHNHNLIHRDIKPENFVIGPDRQFNMIYLIDFGLAKYYQDNNGNHIPIVEKKGMIGTARFASINAHLGKEQSRRDDLEALGYVLLYFLRGKLPWYNIQSETKEEKYEKIKNMKMNSPLEQLCEGCPNELVQYLRIVRKLEFTEQPNYALLRGLFKKVITDRKLESQSENVDWESLPDYKHRKKLPRAPIELPPVPTQREIMLRQQQQREHDLAHSGPAASSPTKKAPGVQETEGINFHKSKSDQVGNNNNNNNNNSSNNNKNAQKIDTAALKIPLNIAFPAPKISSPEKAVLDGINLNNPPPAEHINQQIIDENAKTNVVEGNNIIQKSSNNDPINTNNGVIAQAKSSQNVHKNNIQDTLPLMPMNQPHNVDEKQINAHENNNNNNMESNMLVNLNTSRQSASANPGTPIHQAIQISPRGLLTTMPLQTMASSPDPDNMEKPLPEKLLKGQQSMPAGFNSQLNPMQLSTMREISPSILNNHPVQQQSSLNAGQNLNGTSPVNNQITNSSTVFFGYNQEKRSSSGALLGQLQTHSNNLLNVPSNQGSVSQASLTATSKINNYSASDSDSVLEEGGIQMSAAMMMIDRNASPPNTSDIRRDIHTRSLIIRQSQLELNDLDFNKFHHNNTTNPNLSFLTYNNPLNNNHYNVNQNNSFQIGGNNPNQNRQIQSASSLHQISLLKFDSNLATVAAAGPQQLSQAIKEAAAKPYITPIPENEQENNPQQSGAPKSSNGSNGRMSNPFKSSSSSATEEIKEHQEDEYNNNTNPRTLKQYKTQITPITEVKESSKNSAKTKTSRTSFFGENITESMNERHPIMINVIPIKRAFVKYL